MTWEETCAFLSPCLPVALRTQLSQMNPGELREIRIRAEQPALLFWTSTARPYSIVKGL